MQLPIIALRGQAKPYPGIPRIDWNHPLTRGLISYCYDVGIGPIDLITGKQTVINNASNPPFGGPSASKYGTALSSINTLTSVTLGLYNVAGKPDLDSFAVAAPYSIGCGTMLTANPVSFARIFLIDTPSSGPAFTIGVSNVTTDFWFRITDGSAIQSTPAGSWKPGQFQSLLWVADTGSTAKGFLDGKLSISPAITTTAAAIAGSFIGFHGQKNVAGQSTMSGLIYYGAVWKGRALTASEARLLHDDPYCFLIYPENEMFASLRGFNKYSVFSVQRDGAPPATRMIGY